MKKFSLSLISLLLLCAIVLNATGCAKLHATDLMDGITPRALEESVDLGSQSGDVSDFALRLFRAASKEDGNTLISPLSVLCALAMTANGAQGETREQMESVFGMTVEELNSYFRAYLNALPREEKYKLCLANSVWFSESADFAVNRDFLQLNADHYGADLYEAPFDGQTVRDINRWIKNETGGMITDVLDRIPPDVVMYLINAIAFEAEWAEVYERDQVHDGTFTKEDGTKQTVKMMYDTDFFTYLEDENATGFVRKYQGGKYAFVALLPNEGISVSDYLEALDSEALHVLLSESHMTEVKTAIPKFETEYRTEMSEVLKAMGMTLAFNGDNANFSGIGTGANGNIYIGRVIHQTFIQVGEKGTKAGAVTVVEMPTNGAPAIKEPKQVYLDRPFVYMIIDCENNVPFFIGTMMDVNQ